MAKKEKGEKKQTLPLQEQDRQPGIEAEAAPANRKKLHPVSCS